MTLIFWLFLNPAEFLIRALCNCRNRSQTAMKLWGGVITLLRRRGFDTTKLHYVPPCVRGLCNCKHADFGGWLQKQAFILGRTGQTVWLVNILLLLLLIFKHIYWKKMCLDFGSSFKVRFKTFTQVCIFVSLDFHFRQCYFSIYLYLFFLNQVWILCNLY